jgi:integrase
MNTAEGADVAAYIGRWGPPSVSPAAAAFAREVTACCGDLDRERAKNLLWAAGKLADDAIGRLGLDPVPRVLLHPSVIERFTAHSPGLSPPARRTLRTNLRFIARHVVPGLRPADAPLPRERAKPPYSPAEITGYLALAAAQPTAARRMHATALVCLGAGAGLIRADLRGVRGTDITARSGGIVVTVRGGRAPRVVPVLSRYHEPLLESAAFAGAQMVIGGRDPDRHNLANPLTASLAGGAGLPALDTSRLRATWLADTAKLIGLPAFMAAAGITCSQRLGDITAALDPGGEEHAVALLGGQR